MLRYYFSYTLISKISCVCVYIYSQYTTLCDRHNRLYEYYKITLTKILINVKPVM